MTHDELNKAVKEKINALLSDQQQNHEKEIAEWKEGFDALTEVAQDAHETTGNAIKEIARLRAEIKDTWNELSELLNVSNKNEHVKKLIDAIEIKHRKHLEHFDTLKFNVTDQTGLYDDLIKEGYIDCNFNEFIESTFENPYIEWKKTWVSLSCMASIMDSETPFAAVSYRFYKKDKKGKLNFKNSGYLNNTVKSVGANDPIINILQKYTGINTWLQGF